MESLEKKKEGFKIKRWQEILDERENEKDEKAINENKKNNINEQLKQESQNEEDNKENNSNYSYKVHNENLNKVNNFINKMTENSYPFAFNEEINKKISFFLGNVWTLKLDGVVCCNNENFNLSKDLITKHTLEAAGPQVLKELKEKNQKFSTGDAVLTRGYNLPSPFIIHTFPPKFSLKFSTAAESVLHNCYKNVLYLAKEKGLKTLGLRCIHSSVWNYPPLLGCHVALRTVRRFLEKNFSSLDLVVFVVSNNNKNAYTSLLPIYFPRSLKEEKSSMANLPDQLGDEDGQLFLPERQIRISAKLNKEEEEEGKDEEFSQNKETNQLDKSFLTAKKCSDEERVRRMEGGARERGPVRNQIYKRLLIRSKKQNFDDLIRRKFLYHTGEDKTGKQVMVFVAQRWVAELKIIREAKLKFFQKQQKKNLSYTGQIFNQTNPEPSSSSSSSSSYYEDLIEDNIMEKYRLFFINQLDKVVDKKYNFILVNTHTHSSFLSSFFSSLCFKSLLSIIDNRYIQNLEKIFILHSTLKEKLQTYFQLPESLYEKINYLKGLEFLYDIIRIDQLELPEFVLAYDLDINGVRYSKK